MTSNLPERQDWTPDLLGGQATLFDDPTKLLTWDESVLRNIAANLGREGGSLIAQLRRAAGLVAWAAWYRFPEATYREFAAGLASSLGIEVETLRKWRRSVVSAEKLPVPGVAGQRADAAAKGRKTAGQPGGAVRTSATSKPIPAASTEAPANQSEGKNGAGSPPHSAPGDSAARPGSPSGPSSEGSGPGMPQTRPGVAAPSDPSSGGARTTAPPVAPTDEADPSLRPAPLDPPNQIAPPEAPPQYRADEAAAWRNGYSAAWQDGYTAAVREAADEPVDVDAIGLRWLKSKSTQQIRAIGDPWGPAIRSEVRRWAEAFGAPPAPAEKPQRRAVGKMGLSGNLKVGMDPYPVTIPTIPAPKLAKRHADDCSCLSCKAPKAVAK